MPSAERWEERWNEANTPWDAGVSPPGLEDYLALEDTLEPGHALVPGCGTGYDVVTLARAGHRALGIDVAEGARPAFDALAREAGSLPGEARFEVREFFSQPPAFDLVWDYTFLCALDLDQRPAWAAKMADLIRPGGELICLLFPVWDREKDQGPPFPVVPDKITELLSSQFERTLLRAPKDSHPKRRGFEQLARFVRR